MKAWETEMSLHLEHGGNAKDKVGFRGPYEHTYTDILCSPCSTPNMDTFPGISIMLSV